VIVSYEVPVDRLHWYAEATTLPSYWGSYTEEELRYVVIVQDRRVACTTQSEVMEVLEDFLIAGAGYVRRSLASVYTIVWCPTGLPSVGEQVAQWEAMDVAEAIVTAAFDHQMKSRLLRTPTDFARALADDVRARMGDSAAAVQASSTSPQPFHEVPTFVVRLTPRSGAWRPVEIKVAAP
jgi:hypothetical protein